MIQHLIENDFVNERPKFHRPKLVNSSALDELAEAAGSLHRSFSHHVSRQEGPGGLLALLIAAAPRYLSMVERQRADHRHLVTSLASLRIKIARATGWEQEGLVAELDAVATAVADHEALEREMLRDALDPSAVS
jgi:hypothetical protein